MSGSDEWKLKKLEIEFKEGGEHKGKYVGSIFFQNGELESFRFNIRPNMAQAYIDLISSNIVISLGIKDVQEVAE